MTPEQRQTARARCEAATPGPWEVHDRGGDAGFAVYSHVAGEQMRVVDVRAWDRNEENATLIAHARADLPAALDALDLAEAVALGLHANLAEARSDEEDAEAEVTALTRHLEAAEQEIARLRALVYEIVKAVSGFSRFDLREIIEHEHVAPLLADAARDGRQP